MSGPTEGIVPLNFGAALAAQIPQVEMPADWDAPRRFGLPVGRPGPVPMEWRGAPMGRGVGMVGLGINMAAAIPQVQLPAGWDAPLANPVPVLQNVAATIPQVQLPVGWDAPLMNPVLPPAPQLPTRRGRGRGRVLGPLHNISGGQADPALNGLHRGHIALRERTADYNAHVEQLQERVDAGRQRELALLLRVADERRMAEAAASRERQVQQLAEQERERQKAEDIAKRREAEAVAAREKKLAEAKKQAQAEAAAVKERKLQEFAKEQRQRQNEEVKMAEAAAAREIGLQQTAEQQRQREAAEAEVARQHNLQLLQQVAEQEVERQAATQQAALAAEPLYHDPPRHIDIQAALQERNRREQEWIQRVQYVEE